MCCIAFFRPSALFPLTPPPTHLFLTCLPYWGFDCLCGFSYTLSGSVAHGVYFFVITPMVRLSWRFPLPASSSPSLFARVRFPVRYCCCSYRPPPPPPPFLVAYCLLSCLGLGLPLLYSYFSFSDLPALSSRGLYTQRSHSFGVGRYFCSCLSNKYVTWTLT